MAFFRLIWILSITGLYYTATALLDFSYRYMESGESKWGRYYRNIISDLNIKPYKYHFNKTCNQHFLPTIEDNMRFVSNYSVIHRMKKKFPSMFKKFEDPIVAREEEYPVLVTAASSTHFTEAVKMIKTAQTNLISNYRGMKLVVYNIGLKKRQIKVLNTFCNCEIRTFALQDYPKFVSILRNYTWKPLIIYTMLLEHNFVMWTDSSMIFQGTKNTTDIFFKRVKDVGILVKKLGRKRRSFMYTKCQTFQLLGESVCKFEFQQLEATFITIWKTSFTWKYVIQPWIACALTENCMSHPNPNALLHCEGSQKIHQCHRFEQKLLLITTPDIILKK